MFANAPLLTGGDDGGARCRLRFSSRRLDTIAVNERGRTIVAFNSGRGNNYYFKRNAFPVGSFVTKVLRKRLSLAQLPLRPLWGPESRPDTLQAFRPFKRANYRIFKYESLVNHSWPTKGGKLRVSRHTQITSSPPPPPPP